MVGELLMKRILLILDGNNSNYLIYQEDSIFFIKDSLDPDDVRGYEVTGSSWSMCWWNYDDD